MAGSREAQSRSDTAKQIPFDRALLHPRHWSKWLGIALLSALNLLPYVVLDKIGALIGKLSYRYYEKHRHQAQMNIAWCFPELSEPERAQRVRDHFIAYVQSIVMLPLLWWGRRAAFERHIDVENQHFLDDALSKGPVIVLSCHSVMLDYGAAAIASRYSAVSMYRPFEHPLGNWMALRARSRFNNHLVARGDSLRQLIRLTRSGTPCYHMPDEDLGAKGAVFAPFFGKRKATLTAMSKMARATQATLVPCYPHYLGGGRFRLTFFPALNDYPGTDEVANAHRINEVIEQLIEVAPAQYLWKLRLFKTTEDGSPNPYRKD